MIDIYSSDCLIQVVMFYEKARVTRRSLSIRQKSQRSGTRRVVDIYAMS